MGLEKVRNRFNAGFLVAGKLKFLDKRRVNTTPVIVLRLEADTETALKRIQEDFRRVILEAAPGLVLPF